MGLEPGNIDQEEGMSWAIYQALEEEMVNLLSELSGETVDPAKLGTPAEIWKRISYAIADGVIEHIKENMEVCAIKVIVEGEEGKKMAAKADDGSPCGVIFDEAEEGVNYVE
ncbi:MAG: hypothetical protein GTO49_08330 [Anaerolineae bacterium]|nr:hypothetical protein [Anaerolineae bacterium]